MIDHCKYCNKTLIDINDANIEIFRCYDCSPGWKVSYFGGISIGVPIDYIVMNGSNCSIMISYRENKCVFIPYNCYGNGDDIELDYIPDINPSNAEQWLKRIIDMKVFL